MATVARVNDIELDQGCQGRRDDVPSNAGRGCRAGIDDQQRSHAPRVMVCGPLAVCGPMSGGMQEMRERPVTLLVAASVQAAESLGVLAATVITAVDTASGRSYQVSSGVALTAIGLGTTVALGAAAAGIARVRRWSRTPALLTQLFVGIVAIYLLEAHRYDWGVPLILLAVVGLASILAPPTLRALVGKPSDPPRR